MSEKSTRFNRRLLTIGPVTVIVAFTVAGLISCERGSEEASSGATVTQAANEQERESGLPDGLVVSHKSSPTSSGPEVETVRERAIEIWDARVNDDWATQYDYELPSRIEGVEKDDFVERASEHAPFRWSWYELGPDVYVDGPLAWVFVTRDTLVARFPDLPATRTASWEPWLQLDGEWYPVTGPGADKLPASPALRDHEMEQALLEQFIAIWEHRRNANWRPVYDRIVPASRESIPWSQFRDAQERILLERCRIEWVEVKENRGRVSFAVEVRPSDPNLSRTPAQASLVVEPWVYQDGEWYIDMAGIQQDAADQTQRELD